MVRLRRFRLRGGGDWFAVLPIRRPARGTSQHIRGFCCWLPGAPARRDVVRPSRRPGRAQTRAPALDRHDGDPDQPHLHFANACRHWRLGCRAAGTAPAGAGFFRWRRVHRFGLLPRRSGAAEQARAVRQLCGILDRRRHAAGLGRGGRPQPCPQPGGDRRVGMAAAVPRRRRARIGRVAATPPSA